MRPFFGVFGKIRLRRVRSPTLPHLLLFVRDNGECIVSILCHTERSEVSHTDPSFPRDDKKRKVL